MNEKLLFYLVFQLACGVIVGCLLHIFTGFVPHPITLLVWIGMLGLLTALRYYEGGFK